MMDYFSTSDLNTAAVIISSFKIEPIRLDKSKDGRVWFVFKKIKGLEAFIDNFWQKKLKVEPLTFATAQKHLKNQIYQRA